MSRTQASKATSPNRDISPARAQQSQGGERPAARAASPPTIAHQLASVPVTSAPVQLKRTTGLPENLKSGIESLSGASMDGVKVHYNSPQPAQLQAHAYAHGNDIHVGPGQERHLPHEAWHVVQQKQGRVKPTMQMHGLSVNDSGSLEKEADQMGQRALQSGTVQLTKKHHNPEKKKYLAKGVGKQQNAVSREQRAIINAQPAGSGGISRKEAKRLAKANLG